MGIVAFQWENKQLTLVQNREYFDTWVVTRILWGAYDNVVLTSKPENNFGTWFGISRRGRVVFLVDAMALTSGPKAPIVLLPVDFLRGQMSPREFANKWVYDYTNTHYEIHKDLAYHIVVADINSNSMVYIRKMTMEDPRVYTEEVAFGVHTISSSYGLDSKVPRDLRTKKVFSEMIGNYKSLELPELKEMAEKFVYEAVHPEKMPASSSKERSLDSHVTMSTLAVAVKPSKEVKLYERFLDKGKGVWNEGTEFKFKINLN